MPRRSSAKPQYVTVYGTIPIIIGEGPKADMDAYAEAMNKQAPKYNHRVMLRSEVGTKSKKGASV
jgi:hypothetical protein